MATSNSDEEPEPGDLIEIFRGSFEHWAVYVGDGFIVHLTSLSDVPGASANSLRSVTTKKAMVKKEKLMDVVKTDRWEINNSLDEKYKPHSVEDIVREALAKVNKNLHYDVLMANCEHFANDLRYGKAESRQVVAGVISMLAGGVIGTVVRALFRGRKKKARSQRLTSRLNPPVQGLDERITSEAYLVDSSSHSRDTNLYL